MSGVLQGDTLAPYLFIITLDYALRLATSDHEGLGLTIAKRRSSRQPAKYMTDADYADDIVLMSDTLQDAQTLFHRVEEAALDVGLSINTKNTKPILIGQEDQHLYTLDGNTIETVEDFQYLGVWIVDSKKEVRTRKAKAWSAMLNLNSIWRSDMNRRLKVNSLKLQLKVSSYMAQNVGYSQKKRNTD